MNRTKAVWVETAPVTSGLLRVRSGRKKRDKRKVHKTNTYVRLTNFPIEVFVTDVIPDAESAVVQSRNQQEEKGLLSERMCGNVMVACCHGKAEYYRLW